MDVRASSSSAVIDDLHPVGGAPSIFPLVNGQHCAAPPLVYILQNAPPPLHCIQDGLLHHSPARFAMGSAESSTTGPTALQTTLPLQQSDTRPDEVTRSLALIDNHFTPQPKRSRTIDPVAVMDPVQQYEHYRSAAATVLQHIQPAGQSPICVPPHQEQQAREAKKRDKKKEEDKKSRERLRRSLKKMERVPSGNRALQAIGALFAAAGPRMPNRDASPPRVATPPTTTHGPENAATAAPSEHIRHRTLQAGWMLQQPAVQQAFLPPSTPQVSGLQHHLAILQMQQAANPPNLAVPNSLDDSQGLGLPLHQQLATQQSMMQLLMLQQLQLQAQIPAGPDVPLFVTGPVLPQGLLQQQQLLLNGPQLPNWMQVALLDRGNEQI